MEREKNLTQKPPKTSDKRRNVLLVDDNDELRAVTRELLEEFGYSVTSAARGDEAIDLAMGRLSTFASPPFDLLVSDVCMPGASGLDVTERLLECQADLAVVLISSYRGMPELVARVEKGDISFLAKPFSAAELVAKLAEARERAAQRRPPVEVRKTDRPAAGSTVPTALHESSALSGPPRPSRRPTFDAVKAWQLAAAAVLVLGVGALMRNVDTGAPALPTVGPESLSRTVRSSVVEQVTPAGSLTEYPGMVAWSTVSGARSYIVRVRGVDGEVIWQTEVEQATAKLPRDVASSLYPSVIYYWSVEALSGERDRVAGSGPVPFSIAIGAASGSESQPQ